MAIGWVPAHFAGLLAPHDKEESNADKQGFTQNTLRSLTAATKQTAPR
jgi:hypothetical protein